jgi:hypothetical protein
MGGIRKKSADTLSFRISFITISTAERKYPQILMESTCRIFFLSPKGIQ